MKRLVVVKLSQSSFVRVHMFQCLAHFPIQVEWRTQKLTLSLLLLNKDQRLDQKQAEGNGAIRTISNANSRLHVLCEAAISAEIDGCMGCVDAR